MSGLGTLADMTSPAAETVAEVADALDRTGYLADQALATITFLALRMQRPLQRRWP